jgi:molecular chaperone GrpE
MESGCNGMKDRKKSKVIPVNEAEPKTPAPEPGDGTDGEEADDTPKGPAAESGAASEGSAAADIGGSLEELREECRRLEDRWLRSRAELENVRRRAARDYEEERRRAAERIILPVLEVKDNLEKALGSEENRLAEAAEGGEPGAREIGFFRGIQLIHKQLSEILEREGVSPVETAGRPFDPQIHEAVMQVESKDHESDTIVEEFQRGYLLGDRLLRPARVSVAK